MSGKFSPNGKIHHVRTLNWDILEDWRHYSDIFQNQLDGLSIEFSGKIPRGVDKGYYVIHENFLTQHLLTYLEVAWHPAVETSW